MEAGTKREPQPLSDEQLAAQVAERQRRREEREQAEADREPRTGSDLIAAAANGEKLNSEEVGDALEWFLGEDDTTDLTYPLKINVGGPKQEKWVEWIIRPVDGDTLRKIRQAAAGGTRAQRRRQEAGEIDESDANARIVLEGTVVPDLKVAAKTKGIAAPVEALKLRFKRKPGILGQIAGEIMSISGYDDDDVKEVEAAGN